MKKLYTIDIYTPSGKLTAKNQSNEDVAIFREWLAEYGNHSYYEFINEDDKTSNIVLRKSINLVQISISNGDKKETILDKISKFGENL